MSNVVLYLLCVQLNIWVVVLSSSDFPMSRLNLAKLEIVANVTHRKNCEPINSKTLAYY